LSLQCIGLAQGAKACQAFLQSGVAQVQAQYITFEVIVKRESVGFAFL